MAQSTIISRILDKANEDAANIKNDSKEKAQELKKTIQRKSDEQISQMENDFDRKMQDLEERSELIFHLEARKNRLLKKRELIDRAFAQAKEAMNHLPEKDWSVLIAEIVASSSRTGNETIKVPEKDYEKYQSGFLSTLNKGLKVNGLPGKLTLDSDPAEFEAGILLEGDHYDINGDFEVLLQQVRNKYEREVAAILFEDRDEA